ncbi:MAG: xanthine dehydrogenase family protein subunit M [Deltaproteobacteria bacterium]|nr:xanthine dehydrogenase family protein subunit M [Deltaproteobacteria bacterium]
MFLNPFEYHRAGSPQEALDLLNRHEGAKLIAGGHSLLPLMKQQLAQPTALIDIGRLAELSGVEKQGDSLRIGALTCHAELASSGMLATHCPILAEAAAKVADPQVRNKGTLGGNIAHADPASDLPAVLVATGATLDLMSPQGVRQVRAVDFFVGLLETDLAENELITAIHVPVLGQGSGSCYLKAEHPASGYAVCGAAVVVELGADGNAAAIRLSFNGLATTPVQCFPVVGALTGTDLADEAIDTAVNSLLSVEDPLGDIYASGEYRVQLAKVYCRRALKIARDRARG